MSRCIQLAKNGLGNTYPNPLVGCVIVHNDKIIGEGWHQKSGKPHAEVNAIESVGTNTELLKNATIYVSLEPCSHFGKTPPCADLIISKGIKKVIIGCTDPNPKVAGQGIKKLQDAGCTVITGVLNQECEKLNKRFFTFHSKKRPYIFLKWAQTSNGYISPKKEIRTEIKPVWITNEYSRQLVHKIRGQEMAILVGTNTALEDNPSLNVRDWAGNNPTRLVIDRELKLPTHSSLLDGSVDTFVFTEKNATFHQKTENKVQYVTIDFSKEIATQICNFLFQKNIQSLIVEGGSRMLQTFINANLWDEALIFKGPNSFENGVKAPSIKGFFTSEISIKNDRLQYFKNQKL